jgi:hypothetical protein
MDIGMLWFDNDSKSDLLSKVRQAADYYQNKYGQEPNCCFVHPSMINEKEANTGTITVCPNSTIIPHHFWIGVQQQASS